MTMMNPCRQLQVQARTRLAHRSVVVAVGVAVAATTIVVVVVVAAAAAVVVVDQSPVEFSISTVNEVVCQYQTYSPSLCIYCIMYVLQIKPVTMTTMMKMEVEAKQQQQRQKKKKKRLLSHTVFEMSVHHNRMRDIHSHPVSWRMM